MECTEKTIKVRTINLFTRRLIAATLEALGLTKDETNPSVAVRRGVIEIGDRRKRISQRRESSVIVGIELAAATSSMNSVNLRRGRGSAARELSIQQL